MAEWWDMYHLNPETLPNYIPGVIYDKAGNPLYTSNAPYGGNAAYGGGPNVGYGAVGAPNSGGGAGFVGSGYGYAQPGPPVASIGGFGQRGQGIYSDASQYLGGDFQGGGSDPFAGTIYAGGGGGAAPGNPGPLYSGGGIGSDAGATGGHYETSYSYDGGASNVWVPDAGPSYWGGNNYPDIQGMAPPSSGWGGYDSGIAPDTMGGQGFGGYQPQQPAAPSQGSGWGGAGWNSWFNSPGAQIAPPSGGGGGGGGDYSSARDFMGGGGAFSGVGADGTPMFDYGVFNSPSFDGNWGDAAFAAQPSQPDSQYWQGQGWNPWFNAAGPKDEARMPSGGTDFTSWGPGAGGTTDRSRLSEILSGRGNMTVGPEQYPPTPFGGGFGFNAPTYTGAANISGQGPSWNIPGAFPAWDQIGQNTPGGGG